MTHKTSVQREDNGLFFSVVAQGSKKVNNFNDSVAEAYLNYNC